MKRDLWCLPCGVEGREAMATVVIDGDPMCASCARIAGHEEKPGVVDLDAMHFEREPEPVRICGRGCGKPVHRGRCGSLRPDLDAAARPQQPQTAEMRSHAA